MKKSILITLTALSLGATAYAGNNSDHSADHAKKPMNQNISKKETATTKTKTTTKISSDLNSPNRPYSRNKGEIEVGNNPTNLAKTNDTTRPMKNDKMKNTDANTADVKSVQTSLKNKGYSITVDGQMGQETTTALKKFQKDNKLTVSGKLDSKTKTALMENSKKSENEDY